MSDELLAKIATAFEDGFLAPTSTKVANLEVEIARLTAGLEEIVSAQPTKCKRCKGIGWVWEKYKDYTKTCPRCGGQRKIVFSNDLMNIAKMTLEGKVRNVSAMETEGLGL